MEDNRTTSNTRLSFICILGNSGITCVLNNLIPEVTDAEFFDRWNVWTAVIEPSPNGTQERPNGMRLYMNDRLVGVTPDNIRDVPTTASLYDDCFLMESSNGSFPAQPEMEWFGAFKKAFTEDEIKLLTIM